MWMVIAAWLASLLVFAAFFMKTMVPLRIVAIASNVGFIAYALLGIPYSVFGQVYPIFVLHSFLLPLNVVRLRQLRTLIAAVRAADDFDAIRALIPYTKIERHAKGETLFLKGDPANKLYIVQKGTVRLPEIATEVGPGKVFGEVGLFAPRGLRVTGAVCEEDCELAMITGEKAVELYYQNPTFGLFLIRLVAGYLGDDRGRLPQSTAV